MVKHPPASRQPSRARIMDAARSLFFRQGFGSVSVDDICRAAGVQKGSFYHFFPSKEALLLAAMEDDFTSWHTQLGDVFSTSIPPLLRMSRFVEALVEKQRILQQAHGMVLGIPYATLGSETACTLHNICQSSNSMGCVMEGHYRQALADARTQGLIPLTSDLDALSRHISACVVGALTLARMKNDLSTLRADLTSLFSALFGGHPLPSPTNLFPEER